MSLSSTRREQQYIGALREAVEILSQDGWDVQIQPQGVPSELGKFRPDFLARKGEDLIVGEVKFRGERDTAGSLAQLAEIVSGMPRASLQMIWLGKAPDDPVPERVLVMADQARGLSATVPDAALLLAWAALEGAIEIFAKTIDSESYIYAQERRASARERLSELSSLGEVSETQFERLITASNLRNSVAHGRGIDDPGLEMIDYLASTAESMTKGGFVSIESMIEWFFEEYEDPANSEPVESREGGYLFEFGGPLDALDLLAERFELMHYLDIQDAVLRIESGGRNQWARKSNHD